MRGSGCWVMMYLNNVYKGVIQHIFIQFPWLQYLGRSFHNIYQIFLYNLKCLTIYYDNYGINARKYRNPNNSIVINTIIITLLLF